MKFWPLDFDLINMDNYNLKLTTSLTADTRTRLTQPSQNLNPTNMHQPMTDSQLPQLGNATVILAEIILRFQLRPFRFVISPTASPTT